MTIDKSILIRISSEKYFKRSYHHFFFPEIFPLIENEQINHKCNDDYEYEYEYDFEQNDDYYNYIRNKIPKYNFYQNEIFEKFVE